MIDYKKRALAAEQLRKWYYNLENNTIKSSQKIKIINKMEIGEDTFYKMLRGRTYINPFRQEQIETITQTKIFQS